MLTVEGLFAGILQGISFCLPAGKSIALCGPSGSGKTSLLNAIAGYLPYQGRIFFAGSSWEKLSPWQRPVRYLNQRLYLFPHFTVLQNLQLAQYAGKQQIDKQKCRAILERLHIGHLADAYPDAISGGEQQRAALGRVLVTAPQLVLLDEPFSSLDWELRKELWQELLLFRKQDGISFVLVTHEPQDAAMLTDTIIRLEQGRMVEER